MKQIKLHNPLLETVQHGLDAIFNHGSYADKEVQKILKTNKQFGSRDRSFIAEVIYDIVRWKRNYEEIIAGLKLKSYNWKAFIFISLMKRDYMIFNPEILGIDVDTMEITPLPVHTLSDARKSFPEWMDQRCHKELGNDWENIAEALNIPAKIFIRVNTLRTSAEKLLQLLREEGIEVQQTNHTGHPILAATTKNCIEILSKNNLRNSTLYRNGLFEFQDMGSQVIGEFCKIQQGQTVLDLCAGGGGKTLQLSALMNNKGKIYATDYQPKRLENLEKRMHQAGCRNIELISYEDAKKLKDLDLLLIDAPCSGTGTIKRHPDLKWKLQEENIAQLMNIQSNLLDHHKHQVNAKGKIVYATCSILPAESEDQVNKFIQDNPGMILKDALRINPHQYHCDGFYMAEISRKD